MHRPDEDSCNPSEANEYWWSLVAKRTTGRGPRTIAGLHETETRLAGALRAQGRNAEADDVHAQFMDAWARSDAYIRAAIY